MFIAHAPAGYLLAKTIYKESSQWHTILLLALLVGSVLPDFDMIYFYLVDNRAHNHHSYWTHTPVYWLFIYCFGLAVGFALDSYRLLSLFSAVFMGVILHLFLDTFTGGIRWEYPFSNKYYVMISVPPIHGRWVLNSILHWSFLIELLLVALAGFKFIRSRVKTSKRLSLYAVSN